MDWQQQSSPFPQLNSINRGYRAGPFISTLKIGVSKFWLMVSDGMHWERQLVCVKDLEVSWPTISMWPHSYNTIDCPILCILKNFSTFLPTFKVSIGHLVIVSGTSIASFEGHCQASFFQWDTNYTTPIMLNFTVILALCKVLKGLIFF